MAQLPTLPKAAGEHIKADPAASNYIDELKKLANKALDLDKKVSAEVKKGEVSRKDDDLNFSIIVKLRRGHKDADGYRIDQVTVDGNPVLKNGVDTDSHGEYSFKHSTSAENTHVTVHVSFKDNHGNAKELEKCLELPRISKRQADKLDVIIPGIKGLEVNELDANDYFYARLTTTFKGEGIKTDVELESNGGYDLKSTYFKPKEENTDTIQENGNETTLPMPDSGSVLIRLKPYKDYQEFIFSLPGTDQVVKIVYRKVVRRATKLIITVPGADEKNIVHEPTAPNGGFIVNFRIEDEEGGVKDIVNSTSKKDFVYRVGQNPSSSSKPEHDIEVDKIKTIIVESSKSWQKITFGTELTVPQTFEFRKEE